MSIHSVAVVIIYIHSPHPSGFEELHFWDDVNFDVNFDVNV